jgi:hypothetical protein
VSTVQIYCVPPGHQLTVVTNPDGTRDLAIVFVGDGSNPYVAKIVIPDLDSLLCDPRKCVLPSQSCPDCEEAAREVYGSESDELPY